MSVKNSFLPAIMVVCVLISGILIPAEISARYWIKEEVQYADPGEDPHLSTDNFSGDVVEDEAGESAHNLWRIYICMMFEQLTELVY